MNKLNFVRDGGRRLPPGFRFEPTDEEIVFQYLLRKTFSHPLPALVIPELDVFSLDPWHLPGEGDSEQDMYFFSKYGCAVEQRERGTPCGFWKATASSKQIINSSKRMPIVGIRKSMVFFRSNLIRTNWVMDQYCISLSEGNSLVRIGDWSLCRIYLKKTTQVDDDHTNDHFFTVDAVDSSSDSSSSPHSSASTIFTEVSSSSYIENS